MSDSVTFTPKQLADLLLFGTRRSFIPEYQHAGIVELFHAVNNAAGGLYSITELRPHYEFLCQVLDVIQPIALNEHDPEAADTDGAEQLDCVANDAANFPAISLDAQQA